MINQLTILMPLLAALACAQTNMGAAKAKPAPSAPAETQNKSEDADGREGDGSEGMPGYLTDPDLVNVQANPDAGVVDIAGAAGAVAAESGDVDRVRITVWTVPITDLNGLEISGKKELAAILVKEVRLAADGSFALNLSRPADRALVFILNQALVKGKAMLSYDAAGFKKSVFALYPAAKEISVFQGAPRDWTPDQVKNLATTWDRKFGGLWWVTEMSYAESRAYRNCLVLSITDNRKPKDDPEAELEAAIQDKIMDRTVIRCIASALSDKSDRPQARITEGRWTARQVEWAVNAESSLMPDISSSAYRQCAIRLLAREQPFEIYWDSFYIDPDDTSREPAFVKAIKASPTISNSCK